MTHECKKEKDLGMLALKVLAVERDREADRAMNLAKFEDIREQFVAWGREVSGLFESMRALFTERTDRIDGNLAEIKSLLNGKDE